MPYKIFGCKVNKFYINQRLAYYKTQNIDLNNTLLIATCVVTDRAKNKRLKEAKEAIKQGKQVNITGCGTLDKGKLISEADFFSIYPELLSYQGMIELLGEAPTKVGVSRHSEEEDKALAEPNNEESLYIKKSSAYKDSSPRTLNPSALNDSIKNRIYTKHFIVIQNGCDNYCSFCLTVLKRGQHRNRDLQDIINEIHQIEAQGGKEIVITGINLAARGTSNTRNPQETKFPQLLEEILKQTTIPRIRISSIGPEYANDHFFEVINDERILPHFHYSIQSFSDKVLKLMKRNYDSKVLYTVLKKTRQIYTTHNVETKNVGTRHALSENISIGADIITGFPGETEADFLETVKGIQEFGITKLHAFPFSDHHKGETIPASNYPHQIAESTKKQRNQHLIKIGDQIRAEFLERNRGTTHQVLIEEYKQGKRRGRTENYIQVELEGEYKKGEITTITL